MNILKDELLALFCEKASGKLLRNPDLYAHSTESKTSTPPAPPSQHKL